VAEVGGNLRVLDLTLADVRDAFGGAETAKSADKGPLANDYG